MRDGFVYFMRQVGQQGPIKIGYSETPENRLLALASWCPVPLEMLATIRGPASLEKKFHNRFASSFSHKEWFRPDPELVAGIGAMLRGIPWQEAFDLSISTGDLPKRTRQVTPAVRQRLSYHARVRHAVRLAERETGEGCFRSDAVDTILNTVHCKRPLTQAEIDCLEQFIAAPHDKVIRLSERLRQRGYAAKVAA